MTCWRPVPRLLSRCCTVTPAHPRQDSGGRAPTAFRTSRFCTEGGCVGVGVDVDDVLVVDTKSADLPPLRFTREEWAAFVAGVKNGEFDLF